MEIVFSPNQKVIPPSKLMEEYKKVSSNINDLANFFPTLDSMYNDFHGRFNEFMRKYWKMETGNKSGAQDFVDNLVEDKHVVDKMNRDQIVQNTQKIRKELERIWYDWIDYVEDEEERQFREILEYKLHEIEQRSMRFHVSLKLFELVGETPFLDDLESYSNQLYSNTIQFLDQVTFTNFSF